MSFVLIDDKYKVAEFFKLDICAGYGCKKFSLEKLKTLAAVKNKILISGVQTHSSNVVVIKKDCLRKHLLLV